MRFLIMLLVTTLALSACTGSGSQTYQTESKNQAKSQSNTQSKSISKVKKQGQQKECGITPVRNRETEELAESMAKKVKGVDAAIAVVIDDELDMAVKVTNFNRFRLPEIRKETFQQLRKFYPQLHIHVSTDNKIFTLLQELSNETWTEDSACKHKKKLKDIEKKMRG